MVRIHCYVYQTWKARCQNWTATLKGSEKKKYTRKASCEKKNTIRKVMFGGSWSSSFPNGMKGMTNKNEGLNCGSSVQTGKFTTGSQDLNSCQGLNNIFSYRAGTVPRSNTPKKKKNPRSFCTVVDFKKWLPICLPSRNRGSEWISLFFFVAVRQTKRGNTMSLAWKANGNMHAF